MSTVETLIVVSVVGILSAVAVPLIGDIRSASHQTSVDSGINTLNSAVVAYLTNGGEIPADADIAAVIAKLKTVRKIEEGDTTVVAFGGSFIDQRIQVNQDSSHEYGIRWNNTTKRFEMDASANRYHLSYADTASPIVEEERKGSLLEWGDDWIWTYADDAVKTQIVPTLVSLNPNYERVTFDYSGPSITVLPSTNQILTVASNSAINPGFEGANGFNNRVQTWSSGSLKAYTTDQKNVQGWNTTASDGLIEVWQSGFSGVASYSGNFHVEFNANQVSTLWQVVDVSGMDAVNISFAHGQRVKNTEQLKLMVGTKAPKKKTSATQVENLVAQGMTEVLRTNTNAIGGWKLYNAVYEVPEGVNKLYFAFQSFGEFQDLSYGNFLDEVRFEGVTRETLDGLQFKLGAGNSMSNVIQAAKVRLLNPEYEDDIDLTTELPDGFTTQKNYTSDYIELTITGTAFRHEYQEFLRSIAFSTTSTKKHDRTIQFTINDGYAVSDPAEYIVEFE